MTQRIKAADFIAANPKKKNKYGAKRIEVDGIKFDSQAEADRWCELVILEKGGSIANLARQVPIPLWGRDGPIMTDSGKKQRTYVADFRYIDWSLNGVTVVEDKKGFATKDFNLKKAILAAQNVELLIT